MAPSSSPDIVPPPLDPVEIGLLLDLADATIRRGLTGRQPAFPEPDRLPRGLRRRVGVFVTLSVGDELNGCIGSVEAPDPLGLTVPHLAWSAAFADPRLPALEADGYPSLTIEISVLSPLVPIAVRDRTDLVAAIEPRVHGLQIGRGRRRGLFLPAVWDQLPDPDDFVDRLFAKATLRPDPWPADLEASRFTVEKYTR